MWVGQMGRNFSKCRPLEDLENIAAAAIAPDVQHVGGLWKGNAEVNGFRENDRTTKALLTKCEKMRVFNNYKREKTYFGVIWIYTAMKLTELIG